jgi:hypothetical protein
VAWKKAATSCSRFTVFRATVEDHPDDDVIERLNGEFAGG